jgi:hypothetical protein
MDAAARKGFNDLMVMLPCCDVTCSLNDLDYEMPAGFARIALEARNPGAVLESTQVRLLEKTFGCSLRPIWAHY